MENNYLLIIKNIKTLNGGDLNHYFSSKKDVKEFIRLNNLANKDNVSIYKLGTHYSPTGV